MELYLSRIILNPLSKAVMHDLGSARQLHKTISTCFPGIDGQADRPPHEKRTPRNVYKLLHRVDRKGGSTVLYVQSATRPDWNRLPSGYASQADSKPVHELYARIADGDHLQFRLTANPTKRIGKNLRDDARYQRLDQSEQDEFVRKFRDDKRRRRVAIYNEAERMSWLSRKGEAAGFRLASVRVNDNVSNVTIVETSKVRVWRGRGDDPMTFGSVTFEGVLEVTDADRFREALVKGIGTGKAYGFGLLSIAPVRAASAG
ncbi:MAG: type I-E CRISPR-associated protein Cas6/Cse3/CasE [Pyrinomonadaceae bacterium]